MKMELDLAFEIMKLDSYLLLLPICYCHTYSHILLLSPSLCFVQQIFTPSDLYFLQISMQTTSSGLSLVAMVEDLVLTPVQVLNSYIFSKL